MHRNLMPAIILPVLMAFPSASTSLFLKEEPQQTPNQNPYSRIGAIPCPAGYMRVPDSATGFGTWLRRIPLKSDTRVHLYDGSLKHNQSAQFAVLDISVGHRDLQQCADAVMRLRAEYLFDRGKKDKIAFLSAGGQWLRFSIYEMGFVYRLKGNRLRVEPRRPGKPSPEGHHLLQDYLNTVFMYCGTGSLSSMLRPVTDARRIAPGDVFVRGGAPGHAVVVVDVATNSRGNRIFMLAQSYMPAQDIHILKNPLDPNFSPWYRVNESNPLLTPEWTFAFNQLKTW